MNDKMMFDRYYCINPMKTQRKWRKCSRILFFSLTTHLHCLLTHTCFYKCSIRAVVKFSWLVTWFEGLAPSIHKVAKPCIDSMWIALLINVFLSIKTWLLNTCGTNTYAIIVFYAWSQYYLIVVLCHVIKTAQVNITLVRWCHPWKHDVFY